MAIIYWKVMVSVIKTHTERKKMIMIMIHIVAQCLKFECIRLEEIQRNHC